MSAQERMAADLFGVIEGLLEKRVTEAMDSTEAVTDQLIKLAHEAAHGDEATAISTGLAALRLLGTLSAHELQHIIIDLVALVVNLKEGRK